MPQENVQAVRYVLNNTLSIPEKSPSDVVFITTYWDPSVKEDIILWEDILVPFKEAVYARSGAQVVPFVKGFDYRHLKPLRIVAVPGTILEVVVDRQVLPILPPAPPIVQLPVDPSPAPSPDKQMPTRFSFWEIPSSTGALQTQPWIKPYQRRADLHLVPPQAASIDVTPLQKSSATNKHTPPQSTIWETPSGLRLQPPRTMTHKRATAASAPQTPSFKPPSQSTVLTAAVFQPSLTAPTPQTHSKATVQASSPTTISQGGSQKPILCEVPSKPTYQQIPSVTMPMESTPAMTTNNPPTASTTTPITGSTFLWLPYSGRNSQETFLVRHSKMTSQRVPSNLTTVTPATRQPSLSFEDVATFNNTARLIRPAAALPSASAAPSATSLEPATDARLPSSRPQPPPSPISNAFDSGRPFLQSKGSAQQLQQDSMLHDNLLRETSHSEGDDRDQRTQLADYSDGGSTLGDDIEGTDQPEGDNDVDEGTHPEDESVGEIEPEEDHDEMTGFEEVMELGMRPNPINLDAETTDPVPDIFTPITTIQTPTSSAAFACGEQYYNGEGVTQNFTEAMRWFLVAANDHHPVAQFRLGEIYDSGLGVEQNPLKAEEWLLLAAKQNHALAQCTLGCLYDDGAESIRKDLDKALFWYQCAAVQGETIAQYNLGHMYLHGRGVVQDTKKAFKYFLRAAKRDHIDASFEVACMFDNGNGVKEDPLKAFHWYETAAKLEDAISQVKVGMLYELGRGVRKNRPMAMRWYSRAANLGNEEAGKRMAALTMELIRDDRKRTKAIVPNNCVKAKKKRTAKG